MYYILDDDHNVVKASDVWQWSMWFETFDTRRVDLTEIDGVRISTVFLGLDHRMIGDEDRPLVFETMIFDGEHDGYYERCCTWDEAVEEHQKAVELVRGGGGGG